MNNQIETLLKSGKIDEAINLTESLPKAEDDHDGQKKVTTLLKKKKENLTK